MLSIDLTGKRALVAGVADDNGFGFAIAKALAEAGAEIVVATWPPALNIFRNLLDRGKIDDSRRLANGELLQFKRIYPLDAAYDSLEDAPEDARAARGESDEGDLVVASDPKNQGKLLALLLILWKLNPLLYLYVQRFCYSTL